MARLQARAAAGERWSAQELEEAILLPLMGRKRALPTLLAEASVVLPLAQRKDVLGSMVGLAYTYPEAGLAEQLLEVLRTMNAFEELVADQLIQGRAEGRLEGKQEAVLGILGKRFGAVPEALVEQVGTVRDPDRLTALFNAALDAESLDTFIQALPRDASRT